MVGLATSFAGARLTEQALPCCFEASAISKNEPNDRRHAHLQAEVHSTLDVGECQHEISRALLHDSQCFCSMFCLFCSGLRQMMIMVRHSMICRVGSSDAGCITSSCSPFPMAMQMDSAATQQLLQSGAYSTFVARVLGEQPPYLIAAQDQCSLCCSRVGLLCTTSTLGPGACTAEHR